MSEWTVQHARRGMKHWTVQFVRHGTDGARKEDFSQHRFDAVDMNGAMVRSNELQPAGFHLYALWRD